MKLILFLAFTLALVACLVQAQPVTIRNLDQALVPHSRQKRATCDLLSGLNYNHSLCAAHCIALLKKGGYCTDKGVCVCRS
ncbi:sapecin-C [Drosophila kikkawai]|uniref:Sapecin-C n=1 Tax=Drosophila kikkawai TaxID=30033 RepID=A0A6P4HWI8_DROKI|nr:sapecin-C-like [Drosophila kikkawai]